MSKKNKGKKNQDQSNSSNIAGVQNKPIQKQTAQKKGPNPPRNKANAQKNRPNPQHNPSRRQRFNSRRHPHSTYAPVRPSLLSAQNSTFSLNNNFPVNLVTPPLHTLGFQHIAQGSSYNQYEQINESSEEVNHLKRAIQLAQEETQLTQEIQACQETIDEIAEHLERSKTYLEMLHTKRQAVRQAKISICSNVMRGNVSDEDAEVECTQSSRNRQPNAISFQSQPHLSSSPLNVSNEYPRQALSRVTPDYSSTSNDYENDAATMIPAFTQSGICSEKIQHQMNQSFDHRIGALSDYSANQNYAQASPQQPNPLKHIKRESDTLSQHSVEQIFFEDHDVPDLPPAMGLPEESNYCITKAAPSYCAVPHMEEATGFPIGEIRAHLGSPILQLIADDGFLYTCSEDKTIKKFNFFTHNLVKVFSGLPDIVHCIAISDHPKGLKRLFSGGSDNCLRVLSPYTGEEQHCFKSAYTIHCALVALRGVFLGLDNGDVVKFILHKKSVSYPRTVVQNSALSEENKKGKSVFAPRRFKSTNPNDVEKMSTGKAVCALACGEEGAGYVLIVACQDSTISVRHADNGLLRRELTGHAGSFIFSAITSGPRLFSASTKLLMIHNFTIGTSLMRLQFEEGITSMALKDKTLALGMLDGSIGIFPLENAMPKKEPFKVICGNRKRPVVALLLYQNKIIAGTSNGKVTIHAQ